MSNLISFNFLLIHLFFTLSFCSFSKAYATEALPIPLPKGGYHFQGEIYKKFLKRSKIFDHNDTKDAATIKSLKAKGHLCVRRSTTETICQIKSAHFELPEGTIDRVKERLKAFTIEFPLEPQVEFTHNGSTTKEWMIHGLCLIGAKKLNVYRVTKTYEGEVFLAFPVDEENPISFLTYRDSIGLGYTMILQTSDSDGWKLAYYFEAIYQPVSL